MSDYLLPCHPCGDNNPNQREFEVNIVSLMEHAFTSLLLVYHYCFLKLTQDLDPCLCPVGQPKLPRSLIPTEKQLVEKSIIERLGKLKAVVISYFLRMSHKTEDFSR